MRRADFPPRAVSGLGRTSSDPPDWEVPARGGAVLPPVGVAVVQPRGVGPACGVGAVQPGRGCSGCVAVAGAVSVGRFRVDPVEHGADQGGGDLLQQLHRAMDLLAGGPVGRSHQDGGIDHRGQHQGIGDGQDRGAVDEEVVALGLQLLDQIPDPLGGE